MAGGSEPLALTYTTANVSVRKLFFSTDVKRIFSWSKLIQFRLRPSEVPCGTLLARAGTFRGQAYLTLFGLWFRTALWNEGRLLICEMSGMPFQENSREQRGTERKLIKRF